MDFGLSEADFWNMTLAELARYVDSKRRLQRLAAQEQASHNYILADLIGRSLSRLYASSNTMPPIHEVYPTLFNDTSIQEEIQKKKDEMSVMRFKQFAQSFNSKFKKEGDKKA